MTGHLNDDQLERLLQTGLGGSTHYENEPEATKNDRVHLAECDLCRKALQDREEAMARLRRIRIQHPSVAGPHCPEEHVWYSVAAGIPSPEQERHLRHAIQCEHCGPLLRQAAEDMADEETDQETAQMNTLASATGRWQSETARTLRQAARAQSSSTVGQQTPPSPWQYLFRSRILILASCFVLVITAAVLVAWIYFRQEPDVLIQRAFVEKRTIDFRFEGVPYASLRQERGSPGGLERMQRPALLEAEAETAHELKLHPEDVRWLQASGRANLLEDDPNSAQLAVSLLEKAHRLAPDNDSVSIDLASAYMLRSDLAPVEMDRGRAIEILKPLAESRRGGETAQWNYALAEERAHLWSNAVAEWQNFLDRYPHSAWATEAQANLQADQKRREDQHNRSSTPLKSLEQLAAAFQHHDASALADIDSRIEEYQDAAVQLWFPILFSNHAEDKPSQTKAETAMAGLSKMLSAGHGDRWLADLLAADRTSPVLRQAVGLLAHSSTTLETSDVAGAEQEAFSADTLFLKAHVPAGALRARLVAVFAAQYEHRDRSCRNLAQELGASPLLQRYPWIATQVDLEVSLCSPVADSRAMLAAETAASLARNHRFPILSMRCLTTQSSLYSALGERNIAWAKASEALDTYWSGTFPSLRGYNALIALEELNRYSDRWFLQADILREAVPIVEGDPRTMMVAVANAQLGQALLRTGDLPAAESAYRRSEALIRSSVPGPEHDALWAETELGFARIDLERNLPAKCQDRLQRIRSLLMKMPDSPLQEDYFQTSGTAFLRMNQLAESRRDLNAAADIAEAELRQIASDDDRWRSNRQYDSLYRTIVELKLRQDPRQALYAWEYYKREALPDTANSGDPATRKPLPSDTLTSPLALPSGQPFLLLTYVAFPNGYAVWALDNSGIREHWIGLDMAQFSALSSKFVEECSDPHSNLASLKKDAASLYAETVRPVEPWLSGQKRIVVEPDGALKKIPLSLLIDSHGSYLGDRVDIAVSPGLAWLREARPWKDLSPGSTAFIMANPQGPGWGPLPAAEDEARAVASSFSRPFLQIGRDPSSANTANTANEIADSEIFHFTGHASTNYDNAGLVGDPGFSAAPQLAAVRNGHTRLVVLSACNTSDGTDGSFDGDNSMVRNLLAAHVRTVVASRWNVDSSSTALLMKAFYSGLMLHQSVSASLSSASRVVRARSGYEHPYYWAAFSVFGQS